MDKADFFLWNTFSNQFVFQIIIDGKRFSRSWCPDIRKNNLRSFLFLGLYIFLINVFYCFIQFGIRIHWHMTIQKPGICAQKSCFPGNAEHIVVFGVYCTSMDCFSPFHHFLHTFFHIIRGFRYYDLIFSVL